MPELRIQDEIHHDKDTKKIAIVNLAYFTGDKVTDHEGQAVNINKLTEHLKNFLAPKLHKKIEFASFQVQEATASQTGTITLKIRRWNPREDVVLAKSAISNGLINSINIALREINTDLANELKAKMPAEKAAEPVKSTPAKSTTASTGLFSPEATRAFHAEVAAAIAKAKAQQQEAPPRAKL